MFNLAEETSGNSSFSTIVPGLQFAWDSTSLGALKECPRKYYYSHILGYQPREQSAHLTFGLLYHSSLEAYDKARAAGASYEEGVLAATRHALAESGQRLPSGKWRPWNSDLPAKTRATLVRSVVWYLDNFRLDPARTVILANGKAAVELSFRYDLGHEYQSGEHILVAGHMDRLVTLQEKYWVHDRKTTTYALDDRFWAKFNPDNQMSLYSVAGKIILNAPIEGIIIDGVQVGVGFSRYRRQPTFRTEAQTAEWFADTLFYIGQAEDFALAGYWPMNDKSCGNYGGCPFRAVCAKSPQAREKWLIADFHQRTWDPLKARGDI